MENFEQLLNKQNRQLRHTPTAFKRFLYDQIDWDYRLIEIYGARGTGKTTLMLQRVKQLKKHSGFKPIYVSADDPYFFKQSLYEFVEQFYNYGGTYIFIDEIHRYPPKQGNYDWSAELKHIFDSFPDLHIVYSGSSVLQIFKGTGDLSRRKLSYYLPGPSFREFLKMNKIADFSSFSLEQILSEHEKIAEQITENLRILPYFKQYLKSGYFPFFRILKTQDAYFSQITNIINVIIENDITQVLNIQFETQAKLKRLLSAIATSPPYTSEISNLAKLLGIKNYKVLLHLIDLLEKAELIKQLKQKAKGNKILQKPDKIYLNNTNLMYALDFGQINTGTIRETFFLNQVSYKHKVNYPKTADFLVDDKYLFEIGGKTKTRKQIAEQKNAFVVADDIEIGFGNKIPLWLFGFLY